MTDYLVTGGAGFIGSTLADKLLEQGHKVIVIDNFDPYYERSVKERNIKGSTKKSNYVFIEGDIRDTELLKKIIEKNKIKRIFHLAARAGVRFSVEDPYSYFDLNVNGMVSLLKASLAAKIEKIVFASSSSVYGNSLYFPVDENHPTFPISPYGASKVAAEAFCNAFMKVFSIPIVTLRYFSVYGPRQRPDMAVHKFVKAILNSRDVTVYGDGRQTRSFTYVSDIVNGTINSMEADVTGTFNLGTEKKVSVNELIGMIEEVVGKKAKKVFLEHQRGDVIDVSADISKAKKAFSYKPEVNINDGIKLFYKWYESNVIDSNPGL